jgi:hypothetical protein
LRAPPPAGLDLLQFLVQGLGLRGVLPGRHLAEGGLQVAQHLGHGRVVVAMEGGQLVEQVVPSREAGMAKHLAAGDHLEGDPAEAQGDLDAGVPRVFALGRPLRGQGLEVVVADHEVVGDAQQGGAERAVAVAHQRAIRSVYLVTLVAGRAQAGAARDRLGVGVVLDGPQLAGAVGGADDVDAGEGEQQHVGGLRQPAGELALQGQDFLGFPLAVVVQGQGEAQVLGGGDVARGCLFGPVEGLLDGALLEADAGLMEGVT